MNDIHKCDSGRLFEGWWLKVLAMNLIRYIAMVDSRPKPATFALRLLDLNIFLHIYQMWVSGGWKWIECVKRKWWYSDMRYGYILIERQFCRSIYLKRAQNIHVNVRFKQIHFRHCRKWFVPVRNIKLCCSVIMGCFIFTILFQLCIQMIIQV